ncbi:AbiJ-related protein [Streptomyces hiroshimensis]
MALRQLLGDITALLGDRNTHKTLTESFTVLGMPPADEGSKRERVEHSFAQVPDSDLHRLAERFLQTQSVDALTRNQLQDALWVEATPPEIPMRARRELARAIDPTVLVRHAARFIAMLERFWVLDDDPLAAWSFSPSTRSLRARVERHVIRNPDWSAEDLFEALGAFEAGDARFARFLEAAVAADVLLDETAQRQLTDTMNEHLRTAAIELRETGTDGGYPRFALVPTQLAHTRRPKNVIFASPTKPDIRFRSAVDNDIELVGSDALVYDRTVTDDGIRWRDLQS